MVTDQLVAMLFCLTEKPCGDQISGINARSQFLDAGFHFAALLFAARRQAVQILFNSGEEQNVNNRLAGARSRTGFDHRAQRPESLMPAFQKFRDRGSLKVSQDS
jgi:hypothetical protein